MKIRPEILAITVFLIGSITLLAWFSISKPYILILHSYDVEYSWVKDVNVGIKRVLDPRRDISVRWHYLDSKRHPTPGFMTNAGKIARRMIDEAPPDIIIALDDDAQQYVTRYYLDHPTIKIVFAGVNNEPETYGFERAKNVTGILERMPVAALKESLLIAAQRNNLKMPLRLQFIGDRSDSVQGNEKYFRKYDWAPLLVLDSKLVKTYAEWQRAVLESDGKVDFLVNSNYRKLTRSATDNHLVPASEIVAWTEKYSPVPVIGTNGFFAEDGGMLAIGTSPYEQGEVAAKLAVQILDKGTPPKQLPLSYTRQFVVSMRESAIRNRHFDMPLIFEAAARAGDKYFE